MKQAILIATLMISGAFAQDAAPHQHPKLRKTLAVAACAASAFDLGTTVVALRNPNLVESNPLAGHRAVMTLSILKAASCGVGLYFSFHPRGNGSDMPSMITSGAMTGILSYIGYRNLQLIRTVQP